MKTSITILLIFTFITFRAQEIIVPLENQFTYNELNTSSPIYYKDVNNTLTKFLGNWIYNDGINYLKISITKKLHQQKGFPGFNDRNFEDYLSITMIYKINNTEIYNTTPVPPTDGLIYGNIIKSSNKVELNYNEPTSSCRRQKDADLILEFIPDGGLSFLDNPTGTLKWKRKNRLNQIAPQTTCPDGTLVDSSSFIIPNELILDRE
ncbi:DUF6705 family protein [Flavobacterium sp.]|uniref:DUF6705 family protein n=1 Tax=Flavobacterium sp. TaxID=239 RepID=UPI003527EDB8